MNISTLLQKFYIFQSSLLTTIVRQILTIDIQEHDYHFFLKNVSTWILTDFEMVIFIFKWFLNLLRLTYFYLI